MVFRALWILRLLLGVGLGMAPVALSSFAAAQTTVTQSSKEEQAQIERLDGLERLAGLGRLWGIVKFFHPSLAYRDIDWDAALIAAIPRVKAAKTAGDYQAAINDFLSELKDPSTYAVLAGKEDAAKAGASTPSAAPPTYFRVIDGVVVINVVDRVKLSESNDAAEAQRVSMALHEELSKARGLIFDLRPKSADPAPWLTYYQIHEYLPKALPTLIAQPVTLGSFRFRQHQGYRSQMTPTSGGYYSSLETTTPQSLESTGALTKSLPLAFVINDDLPAPVTVLSGLQSAGLAIIIEERKGENRPVDFPELSTLIALPDGVNAIVKVKELAAPDGRVGFSADQHIQVKPGDPGDLPLDAALKSLSGPWPRQRTDNPAAVTQLALRPDDDKQYADMALPSVEYRLLALFRLWNVTNLFFPYKELMDQPWEPVLAEFIPKFEAAASAYDYEMTVRQVLARMQDSHVQLFRQHPETAVINGFQPPVELSSLEGQSVIVALPDPEVAASAGLKVGDVVVAVDGAPAARRRAWIEPFLAASTPQALRRDVERWLLRGAKDSVVKITVTDGSGVQREVSLKRSFSARDQRLRASASTLPVYGVLPSGPAYIDLGRLTRDQVDAAMSVAMPAPAIIFDLREYPQGTVWELAPRLTKPGVDKPVVNARFYKPLIAPDLVGQAHRIYFEQTLPPTAKPHYQGKVVVLMGEGTQSQGEHSCIAMAAATDIVFVGSPTAGANGDITTLALPGGLVVSFTGQEVRFPDGRQLQRVGVQPMIRVERTIAGVREGRDEVLEGALRFLQQNGVH